jgi:uncharacterized protein
MRIVSPLCLITALSLPTLSLPALAEGANPPTVSATGTGTVEVKPDIATLSVGVTTQGDTAAGALSANSAAIEAVMTRLAEAGIEARDMQTSNLYLNPNWAGYETGTPVISGYVASNMLTITLRNLDMLGAVLDKSISDGANTLNGVTFGLADPNPVLDEARKEAVADARARAELLATAAGMKLGRILTITESVPGDMGYPMYDMAASAPVPVAGGELGLSASVTIMYEISE